MKLSSDVCGGIALIGGLGAAGSALVGIMLLFSKHSLAKTLLMLSVGGFFASIVVFTVFYKQSTRMRHLESEEALIRKLALERLEKDKLGVE